jgi:hypothetical protein
MKYQLLLLVAIIPIAIGTIASCTKTKTNTVTVTKNDTLTVNDTVTVHDTFIVQATLVGTWNSTTGPSPLVLTSSTYQLQSNPPVTCLASTDTIYDISQTNIVYAKWAYTLSGNNDTLYLTALVPPGSPTYVYIKS